MSTIICGFSGIGKSTAEQKNRKILDFESSGYSNIFEDEKEPDCYISNNEPYPLCKGNGEIKCRDCCWFEDYTDYNSPHPEEIIYEVHVEEAGIQNDG